MYTVDEVLQFEPRHITSTQIKKYLVRYLSTLSSGHWLPKITTLLTAGLFLSVLVLVKFSNGFCDSTRSIIQDMEGGLWNKETQLLGGFPVVRGLLGVIDWIVSF